MMEERMDRVVDHYLARAGYHAPREVPPIGAHQFTGRKSLLPSKDFTKMPDDKDAARPYNVSLYPSHVAYAEALGIERSDACRYGISLLVQEKLTDYAREIIAMRDRRVATMPPPPDMIARIPASERELRLYMKKKWRKDCARRLAERRAYADAVEAKIKRLFFARDYYTIKRELLREKKEATR